MDRPRSNLDLNYHILTFDIDWAPDYTIEYVTDILIQKSIKATWFVTHESPAIKNILQHDDLFECGLHPNFLPGSTHGRNIGEVMGYVSKLLPNSKMMRTHGLVQSTSLLQTIVEEYGIEIDVSLLLAETPHLQPHTLYLSNANTVLRIPYFFEDDIEMNNPSKCWDIDHPKYHVRGLKTFNFHPIFIYLNSNNRQEYETLKRKGPLYSLDEKIADPYINIKTPGAGSLFLHLCDYIVNVQNSSYTISEIAQLWRERD